MRGFLDLYDSCKRSQSQEACRSIVVSKVPVAVETYLASYDTCVRLLGKDRCKQYFAPGPSNKTLLIAFGIGLFIGWKFL